MRALAQVGADHVLFQLTPTLEELAGLEKVLAILKEGE